MSKKFSASESSSSMPVGAGGANVRPNRSPREAPEEGAPQDRTPSPITASIPLAETAHTVCNDILSSEILENSPAAPLTRSMSEDSIAILGISLTARSELSAEESLPQATLDEQEVRRSSDSGERDIEAGKLWFPKFLSLTMRI